mmetsp:Transcript_17593/g.66940  ORF Transcript_17593/g.66940 Transcript_17593/m.66940 type:complete len:269 (-) Transcript_17593:169-975(-)
MVAHTWSFASCLEHLREGLTLLEILGVHQLPYKLQRHGLFAVVQVLEPPAADIGLSGEAAEQHQRRSLAVGIVDLRRLAILLQPLDDHGVLMHSRPAKPRHLLSVFQELILVVISADVHEEEKGVAPLGDTGVLVEARPPFQRRRRRHDAILAKDRKLFAQPGRDEAVDVDVQVSCAIGNVLRHGVFRPPLRAGHIVLPPPLPRMLWLVIRSSELTGMALLPFGHLRQHVLRVHGRGDAKVPCGAASWERGLLRGLLARCSLLSISPA